MGPPKVYIDTTVLKFSATRLRRFRPREQTVKWGDLTIEAIVHDIVYVNPNDAIDNPELKAEAELLPTLAEAGKRGVVKYVIQMETMLESWGIRDMDSETGKLYGAPIESVEAPIKYGRVVFGPPYNAKDMQIDFLSGIKHERFIRLQKMTGAYQGPENLNRNQLLDAFHIWCAEHNKCDYFLTLDFKLVKECRRPNRHLLVEVVKPSELLGKISIST